MTTTGTKSAKLAALLKRTAQKLVKDPKKAQKELKKLALTLPLMALLVEEVRAAQNKVNIDANAIVGEVFPNEQELAEFISEQNLDEEQYAELEEELEGVVLAKNDAGEEDDDKGAYIQQTDGGVGAEKAFGSDATGGSLSAETSAEHAAAAADANESFELAGLVFPVPPAAFAAVLGTAGAAVADIFAGTTADTPTVVDATGTNLNTSLKDLQKLGVDFVNPVAGADTLNITLGATDALTSTAGVPLFGDTNRDGTISDAEDAALSVNLHITNAEQLAEVASLSNLASHGIDSVSIDLADQATLNALLADSTMAGDLAAIRNSGLTVNTIDMGAAVDISQAQAATLISNGLAFAEADTVTLQASADSTHLSTSLKDLQKLGVDFVNPVAGADTLNITLGATDALTSTAGVPLFGDTNRDGTISAAEDAALSVNLHITNAEQLAEVASLSSLASHGIDSVSIDLADQATLNALLADSTMAADLAAIRNSGLTVNTIDMGAAVNITQAQTDGMLANGLNFVDADDVTLTVQGTHLSTSLNDLKTLGVDHVVMSLSESSDFTYAMNHTQNLVNHGVEQIDLVSDKGTINIWGAAYLADAGITFDAKDDVTLAIPQSPNNTYELQFATQVAGELQALGIDHIDMASNKGLLTAVQADNLITAGIDFAANDDITLVSNGTYVANHVSDLKALGVDHIKLTSGTNFDVLNSAATALSEAGLGHIDLYADQFAALTSFDTLKDIHSKGVDFNVHYSDSADFDGFAKLIDLYNATDRTQDLATVLKDAGISHINVEEGNTAEYWTDRVATALHDAGILTAASAATVVVDVLNSPVLTTTAKAMAELGVDGIDAGADPVNTTTTLNKVFVGLGTEDMQEAQSILDSFANYDMFSVGTDGALVIEQSVSDAFMNLTDAEASEFLSRLSQLGFNEVDVINDAGTQVDAFSIVAQTVNGATTVELIGVTGQDVHTDVLDADILSKIHKA